MKPTPFRFNVWSLMLIAAIVGIAIFNLRMLQFSKMYDRRVAYHDLKRAEAEGVGDFRWLGNTWVPRGTAPSDRRRADYHASMAKKYEWFARHPWHDVVPDEPEPE